MRGGGARTVLVTPPHATGPRDTVELSPGEAAVFGRSVPDRDGRRAIALDDPAISRVAGEIRAAEDYWLLSNLSTSTPYVVENPEGGGEYVKVPQRRLGAPIPFEFARLLVPSSDGFLPIMVCAPEHDYVDAWPSVEGEPTRRLFALDETAKYFTVLVALCEPRLRDLPGFTVPTASQLVERLAPLSGWADVSRSAVNFHLDYLADTKLRLRGSGAAGLGDDKRAALAALALRLDLVREEHLRLLPPRTERRRA